MFRKTGCMDTACVYLSRSPFRPLSVFISEGYAVPQEPYVVLELEAARHSGLQRILFEKTVFVTPASPSSLRSDHVSSSFVALFLLHYPRVSLRRSQRSVINAWQSQA